MMEVWIARDGDGLLTLFYSHPVEVDGDWYPETAGFRPIKDASLFPEVKPRECRKATVSIDPKPTNTLF